MEIVKNNFIPRFYIRKMQLDDASQTLDLFAEHSLYDFKNVIKNFLEIDSNAFYVAVNDYDGKIIGVCGGPFTNPNFAYIGFYAVKKGFQNKGIGTQIFNNVMEYIGDRNAGITAVPDKIQLYRDKLGFKMADKHHMIITSGKINFQYFRNLNLSFDYSSLKIQLLNDDSNSIWPKVLNYDFEIFGYHRDKLLKLCLFEEDSISMIAKNNNNEIVGFGCVKEDSGHRIMIAPLYADDENIALILIVNLILSYVNINSTNDIVLYILHTNLSSISLMHKLGFELNEECLRFFKKSLIHFNNNKVYCVLSSSFSL